AAAAPGSRTSSGLPGAPHHRAPGGRAPRAPPAVAAQVAAYSDGEWLVLAPRGWRCRGLIGADGTGYLAAYPPGERGSTFARPRAPAPQAVVLQTVPGCAGCAGALACGLFPGVHLQGRPCAAHRAARERVTARGRDVRAFVDPPGVRGTGNPSGGPLTATGLVFYDHATRPRGVLAAQETCALPDAQAPVCAAALDVLLD